MLQDLGADVLAVEAIPLYPTPYTFGGTACQSLIVKALTAAWAGIAHCFGKTITPLCQGK